jgi:DNA-binding transcriptional ArsR family regulator
MLGTLGNTLFVRVFAHGDDVSGRSPAAALAPLNRRLDICLYRHTIDSVARAATTTDAFNAIAEPRRRQILDALATGERAVNDLVAHLRLAQPVVSKHLRVLREVGLVEVRDEGRQRLYQLNAKPLKAIQEWVQPFEQSWTERFDRMDVVLEELKELDGIERTDDRDGEDG